MEDKKTAARTRAGAKKSAPPPRNGGYSVQIGAFKHKREAEAKAAILKAKRYDYVIQPPAADNVVPVGVISPDHVVTPAPVVDYLIANPWN